LFHQQFDVAFAILDVTFDFIERVSSLRHNLLIAELFDIKKHDAGFLVHFELGDSPFEQIELLLDVYLFFF
jgi:hypothetical protein